MLSFLQCTGATTKPAATAASSQRSPAIRIRDRDGAPVSLGLRRWGFLLYLLGGAVGSPLAVAQTSPFEPPPAPGVVSYDGIYQWSAGQYLSLHQDGSYMIATIYFTKDGDFTFLAPDGKGLPVPQLDLFDLMGGPVAGQTAKIAGTRFHRACNVNYDFGFNSDATITVTRTAVKNNAVADASGISCSAIVGLEPIARSVPKIRFN